MVEAVGGKRVKHYRREHKIGILKYLILKLDISGESHTIRCKDFYVVLLQSDKCSLLDKFSPTGQDTVFVLELEKARASGE